MNKTYRLAACAAVLAAPLAFASTAQAELANDSWVEGGLVLYPSAGSIARSQDFIGPEVRGRVAVADDWFAYGGMQYLTDDVDFMTMHGGGAYRFPQLAQPDLEIWAGAGLEYARFSNGGSHSDVGLGLRGGARYAVDERIELAGDIRVVTGDFDYVGLAGQMNYALSSDLDVYGRLDIFDGELGLGGGVRLNF